MGDVNFPPPSPAADRAKGHVQNEIKETAAKVVNGLVGEAVKSVAEGILAKPSEDTSKAADTIKATVTHYTEETQVHEATRNLFPKNQG